MRKLGLIAGGGSLPVEIAEHCLRSGRPFFVIRLKGFASAGLDSFTGAEVGLAELGKCFKALKRAGCQAVCLAGQVNRPDFTSLMPDLRGLAVLPAVIAAARKGDDALLRMLIAEFEKEGFTVEGGNEVIDDLGIGSGPLGRISPTSENCADVSLAVEAARTIGRLDAGQAAVVCRGLILALEAAEGTDALLARVADLPEALRGRADAPMGVLAKMPKPTQETRVDLPTIGPETVKAVARAGLAGIVGEVGHLLVLDRDNVVALADELGIFVFGVEPPTP